jgi:hypothetical protein
MPGTHIFCKKLQLSRSTSWKPFEHLVQTECEYPARFDFEAKIPQGLEVAIDMSPALVGDPVPQLPASNI